MSKTLTGIKEIIALSRKTAVLCEDECGSFCFCSKAEWTKLIEEEIQAKNDSMKDPIVVLP